MEWTGGEGKGGHLHGIQLEAVERFKGLVIQQPHAVRPSIVHAYKWTNPSSTGPDKKGNCSTSPCRILKQLHQARMRLSC